MCMAMQWTMAILFTVFVLLTIAQHAYSGVEDVDDWQKVARKQEAMFAELSRVVDRLQAKIERLELENERQQQTIDELSAWKSQHKNDMTSYPASNDFLGFSAYATSSQTPDYGDRVLFVGVTTNVGVAYDSVTSIFTCPTSAYYYVYFHLMLYFNDDYASCYIDIMLDSTRVVQAYESTPSSGISTTSTSVVLECEAGSEVWVQSDSDYCYVLGFTDYQRSNFGGFLLQPL